MQYQLLMIEDDERVIYGTKRLLESRGYILDVATKSSDGLKLLQDSPEKYAVAILDYHMPDVGGEDLIKKALTINPEKSGKWEEPERGNKFLVCKYEKDGDGKSGKARKTFSSFAGAMEFRRARETPVTRESQTAKEVADSSNAMTFRKLVEIWKADFLPNKELPTQTQIGGLIFTLPENRV